MQRQPCCHGAASGLHRAPEAAVHLGFKPWLPVGSHTTDKEAAPAAALGAAHTRPASVYLTMPAPSCVGKNLHESGVTQSPEAQETGFTFRLCFEEEDGNFLQAKKLRSSTLGAEIFFKGV